MGCPQRRGHVTSGPGQTLCLGVQGSQEEREVIENSLWGREGVPSGLSMNDGMKGDFGDPMKRR